MQEPRLGYEYWPLDMERMVLQFDPSDLMVISRDNAPAARTIYARPVGARWRVGLDEHTATWDFAVTELDGKPVFIHTPVRETVSRVLY